MFSHKERIQRNVCRWLMVMIVTILAGGPASAFDAALCEDAVWVEPGGEWAGYGPVRREILAFDVTSKGFFGLQATATSPVEPQLVALGRDCAGDAQGIAVLRRYVSGYVFAVEEPGTYYFVVSSQNPGEPLHEYEVTSRFVSWRRLGPIQAKGITEGEDDPDLLVPPGYCEADDDHADTFDCATDLVMGEPASGEVHRGDVDTFTFRLDDQATVFIESVSKIDVIGSLYDENGHRLALDDDGGHGDDFQITKTLSAGRYFVTVEGRGAAEGSYLLTSELLGW